jgi:hypothetical protein
MCHIRTYTCKGNVMIFHGYLGDRLPPVQNERPHNLMTGCYEKTEKGLKGPKRGI